MADTTREELGQIVSLALANMIQEGRWYTNWRTRDEESQWTKDDFHLIERDQIGKIGFAAIDVVHEIEDSVFKLIQSEITKAQEQLLDELVREKRSPIALANSDKFVGGVIPMSVIEAKRKEIKEIK